jgi:uncharacterized protein YjiS (DUF1127 family)
MTTIHRTAEFAQTAELAPQVSAFLKRWWSALQERRKRARLRAALHALPDRHLRDIGIARGEIEYLALNGTDERFDPRKGALGEAISLPPQHFWWHAALALG